jgi:hypothetical protein
MRAQFDGSRAALAEAILLALEAICRNLPGKLILVIDQAEEVPTHTNDELELKEKALAFFEFLENIYLRNIDVRIVVAMRTEYYGRFRDELSISDDRLGSRPKSGGIEPYLLRPLRNPGALFRIVMAPTLVSIYKFKFDENAARRIVSDLLEMFPHGSITPLLQIICAKLYSDLEGGAGKIELEHYVSFGGAYRMAIKYIDQGVRDALPISLYTTLRRRQSQPEKAFAFNRLPDGVVNKEEIAFTV